MKKMVFRGKRSRHAVVLLLLVAVLALAVWRMWMPSERVRRHSAAVLELASRYELSLDDSVIMTLSADTVYAPAVWINRFWMLPSCLGRLASAPIVHAGDLIPTADKASLNEWLTDRLADNDSILRGLERQQQRLRYYFRTHGVQDEGYEAVFRYALKMRSAADSINHQDSLMRLAISRDDAKMTLQNDYSVIYKAQGRIYKEAVSPIGNTEGRGYMRFRTRSRVKPVGVAALSLWPWVSQIEEQFFTGRYGEVGFRASRQRQITRTLAISRDTTNAFLRGSYTGFGVEYSADSLAYAGNYVGSKRQGRGRIIDHRGWAVSGLFSADTLVYGTKTIRNSIYQGEMNVQATPSGHGYIVDGEQNYYEGNWRDGLPDGFGFAIGPDRVLRVGEWEGGSWRGERLTYTSERIYGIDISRFQHEVGKKKYPIDWAHMRITNLGSISRKRVSGKIDYPVSFIYIKATEGTTVVNSYYADDYRQAHRASLHVGSYHFFSTTSAADKQARWFLKNSKVGKGDFPPVLDVEPLPSQIRKMGGEKALFAAVRQWLSIVERSTGMRPILYVSQSFVNNYLPSAPDLKQRYQVWIARYGEYKPDVRMAFWQLSPDGAVSGIHGDVDINVFNGYRTEFNAFINASSSGYFANPQP